MKLFLATLALLLGLSVPAASAATPSHPSYALGHAKKCKVDFVKKTAWHDVHGKRVHYVECIYHAPVQTTSIVTPAPVTPPLGVATPAPVVSLQAHLDPTFVQSPTNPLAVTYDYSASATETVNGVMQPAQALPTGILNLYSDGLLICSMNVGGATTGGLCPITYSSAGNHSVITTYDSGSSTASETDIETISQFSTTTVANVTQTSCNTPPGRATYCTFTIQPMVTDQNGNPVVTPVTITFITGDGTTRSFTVAAGSTSTFGILYGSEMFFNGNSYSASGAADWSVYVTYAGSTGWASSLTLPESLS